MGNQVRDRCNGFLADRAPQEYEKRNNIPNHKKSLLSDGTKEPRSCPKVGKEMNRLFSSEGQSHPKISPTFSKDQSFARYKKAKKPFHIQWTLRSSQKIGFFSL